MPSFLEKGRWRGGEQLNFRHLTGTGIQRRAPALGLELFKDHFPLTFASWCFPLGKLRLESGSLHTQCGEEWYPHGSEVLSAFLIPLWDFVPESPAPTRGEVMGCQEEMTHLRMSMTWKLEGKAAGCYAFFTHCFRVSRSPQK